MSPIARYDTLVIGAGIGGIAAARRGRTADQLTAEDWLSSVTRVKLVHSMLRNMCASFFAANLDEIKADAFLGLLQDHAVVERSGFCPEGTIGVPRGRRAGLRVPRRRGLDAQCRPGAAHDGRRRRSDCSCSA